MNKAKLDEAINEAERFLDKANIAKKNLITDPFGNKYKSAVKRASMDLTRSLSELRKSTLCDIN